MFGIQDMLHRLRIGVKQPVNATSLDHMFIHDLPGVRRLHLCVERVIGQDLDDRSFFTKAETAGTDNLYLPAQSFSLHLVAQHLIHQIAF